MYQLQRGPMLGDVAGHADERALLHTCFLAATSPIALLMMAPALYIFAPAAAAFSQVPSLDLAVQTGTSVTLVMLIPLTAPLPDVTYVTDVIFLPYRFLHHN